MINSLTNRERSGPNGHSGTVDTIFVQICGGANLTPRHLDREVDLCPPRVNPDVGASLNQRRVNVSCLLNI